MSARGKGNDKRKRKKLTIQQKFELINKLEEGLSVRQVCELYGVKKQTVSDIRKAKGQLMNYSSKFCMSRDGQGKKDIRKNMRFGKDASLEQAVLKWYQQQRLCQVNVRGVTIKMAAEKLAGHLGIKNFSASSGWLWRLRNRYGFTNKNAHGEAASADMELVEPFRTKLNKLITDEELDLNQIYNADETGLFWRSLPRNTQVCMNDDKPQGEKVNNCVHWGWGENSSQMN